MSARVSRKLHDRLERLPAAVRDIAWKAQLRLCARYRRLVATGKAESRGYDRDRPRDGRLHLGDCPRQAWSHQPTTELITGEAVTLDVHRLAAGPRWGTLARCYEPVSGSTLAP